MAESSGPVLVSDDNVVSNFFLYVWMSKIPFRDSIKSIEALVGWLTRKRGFLTLIVQYWLESFQIDEDNVRDLAMIADKYIIDSLHQDIQVNIGSKDPPLIRSELLSNLSLAPRETHH